MKGPAWEQLQFFRRGWIDGAASRPKRQDHVKHPTRPDLSKAYCRGYDQGHATGVRECSAEAERLGVNLMAAIIDR